MVVASVAVDASASVPQRQERWLQPEGTVFLICLHRLCSKRLFTYTGAHYSQWQPFESFIRGVFNWTLANVLQTNGAQQAWELCARMCALSPSVWVKYSSCVCCSRLVLNTVHIRYQLAGGTASCLPRLCDSDVLSQHGGVSCAYADFLWGDCGWRGKKKVVRVVWMSAVRFPASLVCTSESLCIELNWELH